METFSAFQALLEKNQRPLWRESNGNRWFPFTKDVDFFFDLRLNKQ